MMTEQKAEKSWYKRWRDINLTNKRLYSLIILGVLLALSVGVYSYRQSLLNPSYDSDSIWASVNSQAVNDQETNLQEATDNGNQAVNNQETNLQETLGMSTITHYNTGDTSEQVTSLPIAKTTPYKKRVIYSQRIDDLKEREILIVLGEFEVTHEKDYNVMIGSQIILANAPKDIVGKEISEANGYNFDRSVHHAQTTKVGSYEITSSDPGTKYVNLVAYAASINANSKDTLKVEQDYGRLSVIRISR